MTKRVKMVVAYDGTNYCGWQKQPNGICIEEVLNRELSKLLNEPIEVIGASRTDSGVHARGNIAVFDTHARMPADKICIALNQRLPKDIVIQESCEVAPDYHPRKRNTRKTYEYRILNRRVPLPDQRLNSYFYYYALDVDKMREAAQYLVGEHDFKSFCSIRTQVEDTVRRIYSITIKKNEDDRIDIRISGNGFLYNMVRIIVGSLVKVGCGFWKPEQIKEALEARDRSKAGPKAPAEGLTLISIEEETLPAVIREKNEHWSYRVNQGEIESFGKAYIQIYACDECDFERLLVRLVKQASRNGAAQIHVRDNTGHLKIGYQAEYFSFDTSYNQWKLAKTTEVDSKTNGVAIQAVSLDTSDSELVEEYCNLENECFKQVPGGVKRTSKQLLLDIAEGERCFSLCKGDAQVGFFSAKKIKNEETGEEFFELESLGVSEAFRNQGIGKEGLLMFEQLAAENGYEKLSMIWQIAIRRFTYMSVWAIRKRKCSLLGTRQETKKGIFMNKRTNSKENDTISKKTGNKARQLSIYFFQAISLIALLFCVWLLTREKEYREIDVNTVAQNLVELMPDTVVSESDMVVKERFGLEANAFNGLVYYGPDSNMEAAELLLVNLKDISQKESVEEAIQKRIEYQKSCFEGYGVDQMELINNAMTITYGHYMLFIVSKDSSLARDAFADATAK
ncbi:MAG: tRNA pseudouridine(38-40) synthase TruA [Lachnospiraceae bacterium]